MSSMTMKALVRRPGPRLTEGIVTHIHRVTVDHAKALDQWAGYISAMSAAGWQTVEVPPADDCPDAVFIEDTMVVYGSVAIIALPGAESRRAETAAAEVSVAGLGYTVMHILQPGTLDGGDVLKVDDTVYVALGGRTNADGIAQFRAILEPLGATVVTVPLSKVLHLKTAITALPDGTIIGWPPALHDVRVFPRFMAVPEPSGAHVVLLGDNKLLMSSDCPRTAAMFTELGYEPVIVDIDEFIKLEGCVTCLSVRLRDVPRP